MSKIKQGPLYDWRGEGLGRRRRLRSLGFDPDAAIEDSSSKEENNEHTCVAAE